MRIPKHRRRSDGRGVVTINSKDRYTGKHGTAAADQEYRRLVAEMLTGKPTAVVKDLTVAGLIVAYGNQARENRDRRAFKVLQSLYGDTPADAFGCVALEAVRGEMVRKDWTRADINLCVNRIRRAWRWAVSREFVPPNAWERLRALEALKPGECRESKSVVPVDENTFRASLPFLSPQLRAAAELQWLTGMRAGEVLAMQPANVDRSTWTYRPVQHKGKHRGHVREIALGPKARAVLLPWLVRGGNDRCFVPSEADQRGRDHYSVSYYGLAIRRAALAAKVGHWSSHQLRHAAATRIRAEAGPEAAQAVLGHRHLRTTEIYAATPARLAAEVMQRIG